MAAAVSGETNDKKHRFPPIVLDTTLCDLLAQDSNSPIKESLCNVKPNCDARYTAITHNDKYPITSSEASDGNDLAHLQLENVSYLLSFWAGRMDVAMVAANGYVDDHTLTKDRIEANALRSFSILNEDQRPRPRTFANVEDFVTSYGSCGVKVRWGFSPDFAEQVPSFVHPEVTYKLNSKRWLAQCGLKSANDQIIDPECSCLRHATKGGQWFYGSDCSDCGAAIKQEFVRVRRTLEDRKPPYVLKLT